MPRLFDWSIGPYARRASSRRIANVWAESIIVVSLMSISIGLVSRRRVDVDVGPLLLLFISHFGLSLLVAHTANSPGLFFECSL